MESQGRKAVITISTKSIEYFLTLKAILNF